MLERHREILTILSNNDCWFKGKELASHFQISDRTIRNDISQINDMVGAVAIIADKHLGYRYNKLDVSLGPIKKRNISTVNDRLLFEIKTFLCDGSFNIFDMAELLHVSESTVENDLSAISRLLRELDYDKANLARNGFDVSLAGSSHYLNNLLYEAGRYLFSKFNVDTVAHLFPLLDLNRMVYTVNDIFNKINVPRKYLRNTEITLDIAILHEKNRSLFDQDDPANDDTITVVSDLIKTVKQKYCITVPPGGLSYFNIKIKSLLELSAYDHAAGAGDDPVSHFFDKLADEIMDKYVINIKENPGVFAEMVKHTRVAVKRIKYGYKYYNPIKDQIYTQSIYVIDIVLYFCRRLTEVFGVVFDSNEISYLIVYMGIIMEPYYDAQITNHKMYILIVNMESKATLKHLIKFINSCFSNTNIVWREINSYLELERANELSHFFDFVIVYGEIIPGKIKPDVLIAGYITPVEKKLIVESILRKSKEIWAQKFENIIMKYFDKELVFHLHTLTPQESIFFLADKAVELGIAEKGFYDAIMRREEFMPTSQPSGVALPHALEFKTNKSVFLIGILDEPIKWGNGKVKLVFLLSSALKDEHTLPSITSFFSSVFSNKDNRSSILKINSYDEIRKVLQSLFYARYDL